MLERLGETQAGELSSGLPHDRYLFTAGTLTALRRVYTLVDDLIVAATNLEGTQHDRNRKAAEQSARRAAGFVNTPWYYGWRTDAVESARDRR